MSYISIYRIVYVRDPHTRNPVGLLGLRGSDENPLFAASFCHPNDNFEKKRAREIVLGRLSERTDQHLEQGYITRIELLWEKVSPLLGEAKIALSNRPSDHILDFLQGRFPNAYDYHFRVSMEQAMGRVVQRLNASTKGLSFRGWKHHMQDLLEALNDTSASDHLRDRIRVLCLNYVNVLARLKSELAAQQSAPQPT